MHGAQWVCNTNNCKYDMKNEIVSTVCDIEDDVTIQVGTYVKIEPNNEHEQVKK